MTTATDLSSSVARVMALLEVVGAQRKPLSLSEIAERTGLPKSTTFRYVRDLESGGGVERAHEGGYIVGSSSGCARAPGTPPRYSGSST